MKQEFKDKFLYPALLRIGTLLVILLVFFIIYRFQSFKNGIYRIYMALKPFIYGIIIAYLIKPLCTFIEKWILRVFDKHNIQFKNDQNLARGLGIAGGMVLVILMISGFFALILPNLVDSVVRIVQILPANISRASKYLSGLAENNPDIQELIGTVSNDLQKDLMAFLQDKVIPNMEELLGLVSLQIWNIVIGLKNLLVGLCIAVYVLSCREHLKYQVKVLLLTIFGKKWFSRIRGELHIADTMFEGFIYGKLIDSLIIGMICFIVMSIFKWPYSMLISTIIGVTNMIPFFGPFIGAVPSALLMLMISPRQMVYFLIFVLILQQVDGNIIGPKILGSSIGLSGIWVLFATTFFGSLFGIAGMLLGVPVFAVIYDLVKKITAYVLTQRGVTREERERLKE